MSQSEQAIVTKYGPACHKVVDAFESFVDQFKEVEERAFKEFGDNACEVIKIVSRRATDKSLVRKHSDMVSAVVSMFYKYETNERLSANHGEQINKMFRDSTESLERRILNQAAVSNKEECELNQPLEYEKECSDFLRALNRVALSAIGFSYDPDEISDLPETTQAILMSSADSRRNAFLSCLKEMPPETLHELVRISSLVSCLSKEAINTKGNS